MPEEAKTLICKNTGECRVEKVGQEQVFKDLLKQIPYLQHQDKIELYFSMFITFIKQRTAHACINEFMLLN